MHFYKNLSLQSKIFLATLLLCLGISCVTTVIFVYNDLSKYENLNSLINDVIKRGSFINAAIREHQANEIENQLKILELDLNLKNVELFSFNGKSFSTSNNRQNILSSTISNKPNNSFLTPQLDSHLELIDPIVARNKIIGALYVSSVNNNENLISILEVVILAIIITLFIALYLGDLITQPLQQLVDIMRRVTYENDFSLRAEKKSNDEVGILVDTFNTMLSTIQDNEKLQRASQEQIKKLAYYDALTGIPNRDLFTILLSQEIEGEDPSNEVIEIIYFDFANINMISDTLGYDIGDLTIQNLIMQIERLLIENGNDRKPVIGRLNYSEFAFFIRKTSTSSSSEELINRLLNLAAKQQLISNHEVVATMNIGIASYPQDGKDTKTLLKNASIAMLNAKQKDKNIYAFFNNEMNQIINLRMKIENDLYKAIERNELIVYYQPKFDIRTNHIVGMEALIRWQHPTYGLIPPDEFISIAEESGLITDIGAWIMHKACQDCKKIQALGFPQLYVSANVSGIEFDDPSLLARISNALNQSGLEAQYLDLELTESIIMMNDEKTLNTLQAIRNMGLRISIDDFGTGYSSLRYLAYYPIHTIKIDKTFIFSLLENKNNAIITKAIINLAHSLHLTVVAEGVETQAQFEFLKKYDCDEIQGMLISKPIPKDDFIDLLIKQRDGTYVERA